MLFRRHKTTSTRSDGYVPNPDDAELQEMVTRLVRTSRYTGTFGAIHFKHAWTVESGTTADGRRWHRWVCTCPQTPGPWRLNKDMANWEGDHHVMWGDFG